MFKWTVALDHDTVFDTVKALEQVAHDNLGNASAIGRDLLGLASRLRTDYAKYLRDEADAVTAATGLWARGGGGEVAE